MSSTKVIKTANAPDPVGPYNQAIKAGNFIYCSGQIAIDPVSNKINCLGNICLLYTSDAADDLTRVDLGGRRIIKKITVNIVNSFKIF